MMIKINKTARADIFRKRLALAIAEAGSSQSALAREIGTDRSTLSQALSGSGPRLPGAHVVGAAAQALGVSSDWLLGVSDRPESTADLVADNLSLSLAERALVDAQVFDWHREAAGYKIRYVPAFIPDMLKTDAMLEWEFGPHLGRSAGQAIAASRARLDWMRRAQSDYEVAMPLYELHSFASGTGYYAHLPRSTRAAQITHLQDLCQQLYPRLRIYLYDARRLYAAPLTVFGPLLAVLYTGGHYVAFRDRERIEIFTQDFDLLVREATVTARGFTGHLDSLRKLTR